MNIRRKVIIALLTVAGFSINYTAKAQEDIPAQVRTVAESKTGGHKITKWFTDKKGGKYVATVLNEETFRTIEVDTKGKWLRTMQVFQPDKAPDAITKAVAPYLKKGYEADNYILTDDASEGKYFTVDLSSDDDDATLYLSPEGKVLKKEER